MTADAPNGRILIVDDHSADRCYLRDILREENYDIIEAADGSEALEMAAELVPDLLLVDVLMPGLEGYGVCRSLREDPDTTDIPIVVISGLPEAEDRLRALEAGATESLVKPVEPEELRLRVRNLLRQRQAQRELETKLRESQRRERLRDEWATYIVAELDDHLNQWAKEAGCPNGPVNEARQLTAAITGCRELSQAASVATEACDLVALVSDMEASTKSQLDYEGLDGVVQGNSDLLSRVLGHLLRISRGLASEEDLPLEIRSSASSGSDGGHLTVEVISQGSGIWHQSFEKLDRGSVTNQPFDCQTRQELYLSFCKHALDLMGGHIGVETSPGHGVRFWFSLPQPESSPLPLNVITFNAAAEHRYDDAVSR